MMKLVSCFAIAVSCLLVGCEAKTSSEPEVKTDAPKADLGQEATTDPNAMLNDLPETKTKTKTTDPVKTPTPTPTPNDNDDKETEPKTSPPGEIEVDKDEEDE